VGLTIKGLAAVQARIARSEERVMDGSLSALRAMAQLVVEEARRNAPVDTGDLENAIVAVEERERTLLGRFGQTTIRVGVDVSKLDLEAHGGYDYSIRMHEDSSYNLGPRSEEKQAALGNTVGYKYLERALKENQAKVQRAVEEAIRRGIS
jgi:hypothetical protein